MNTVEIINAEVPLAPMDHHEKARVRAAALRAKRIYPGAVGELVAVELLAWHDFGYRLDNGGLIMKAVHEISTAPLSVPAIT